MSEHNQHTANDAPATPLAVFADSATLPALTDMLQRLGRNVAHLQAGGVEQAMDWIRHHALPETLMVDISHERYPLQAFNELATLCGPGCAIILLGNEQRIDLYRQLLQAGAVDYLAKPCTLDLLADTLNRIDAGQVAMAHGHSRAGRTLAITGVAGGVGTSTVTAGLGQLLASQHQLPCVAVDFDRCKGDLPLLLGSDADAGLASLLAAPSIDPRLLQRSVRQLDNPTRLHLLAQRAGAYGDADPERVLELGGILAQMFSLSLWDLPSSPTPGVPEVLEHADVRLILTDMSVQHARHTYRLLQQYGNESNGQRLLLILNHVRSTERTGFSRQHFEDFIGRGVDLVLPHAGQALDGSLLHGPLELARHTGFQQGLQQLASLVTGKPLAQAASAANDSGWLPSLLGRWAKPAAATAR